MRIEALLEATCRRLRLERKHIKREFRDDDDAMDVTTKKSKLGIVAGSLLGRDDDDDSIELEADDSYDKPELTCMETSTMLSGKDTLQKPASLWDDPKQVEDFLKLVNASNNINNNTLDDNFNKKIGLDFADDFLGPCGSDDPASNLSSSVANYDVNSFTVEFDNLYKELVQNLVTVESFMSQPTCM